MHVSPPEPHLTQRDSSSTERISASVGAILGLKNICETVADVFEIKSLNTLLTKTNPLAHALGIVALAGSVYSSFGAVQDLLSEKPKDVTADVLSLLGTGLVLTNFLGVMVFKNYSAVISGATFIGGILIDGGGIAYNLYQGQSITDNLVNLGALVVFNFLGRANRQSLREISGHLPQERSVAPAVSSLPNPTEAINPPAHSKPATSDFLNLSRPMTLAEVYAQRKLLASQQSDVCLANDGTGFILDDSVARWAKKTSEDLLLDSCNMKDHPDRPHIEELLRQAEQDPLQAKRATVVVMDAGRDLLVQRLTQKEIPICMLNLSEYVKVLDEDHWLNTWLKAHPGFDEPIVVVPDVEHGPCSLYENWNLEDADYCDLYFARGQGGENRYGITQIPLFLRTIRSHEYDFGLTGLSLGYSDPRFFAVTRGRIMLPAACLIDAPRMLHRDRAPLFFLPDKALSLEDISQGLLNKPMIWPLQVTAVRMKAHSEPATDEWAMAGHDIFHACSWGFVDAQLKVEFKAQIRSFLAIKQRYAEKLKAYPIAQLFLDVWHERFNDGLMDSGSDPFRLHFNVLAGSIISYVANCRRRLGAGGAADSKVRRLVGILNEMTQEWQHIMQTRFPLETLWSLSSLSSSFMNERTLWTELARDPENCSRKYFGQR